MPRASTTMRRRRPAHSTLTDVENALSPFKRPPPRTPYDVPESFNVIVCRLAMVSKRLEFLPSAKTELAKFLPGTPSQIDDGLTWLAGDLGGSFFEEFHHARRYTKRQLEVALLALLRLQCTSPLPVLPEAFLRAVESAERRRASGALLPHDVPRSQIFAQTDIDELMDAWRSPGSVEQL